LPNRVNVADAVKKYGYIYAFTHVFYLQPIDWWERELGHVYLDSAGNEIVAIANQPQIAPIDSLDNVQPPSPMGSTIVLRGWRVKRLPDQRSWQITLYWQAITKPDRDYSVF